MTFGRRLPRKMGAGGMPVREPTRDELKLFLKCLDHVPSSYFSSYKDRCHPDYGTRYTAVIVVDQWLKLIRDANLLEGER